VGVFGKITWGSLYEKGLKTRFLDLIPSHFLYAERARFELAVEFNPYDGLANRWFQPLTHLSKAEILKDKDNI
jgi:hypothetical protein